MNGPHAQALPEVSWKVPASCVPSLVNEWLGPTEWNCSAPLPSSRRVAIVSSRLPRLLAPNDPWLTGLRAVMDQNHEADFSTVVAEGAAGWELVFRCAIRHEIPVICFHFPPQNRKNVASWLSEEFDGFKSHAGCVIHAWAMNPAKSLSDVEPINPEVATMPMPDRAALAWADEIVVLRLRSGGNLHRLLSMRLRCADAIVRFVDLPHLQSRKARGELIGLGARLWQPPQLTSRCLIPQSEISNLKSEISNLKSPLPCPSADGWDFLTHTTRACPGPWPGQSREDFLDSLLDARPDADHSPLAALSRIIAERRLRASNRTIRGKFPVVSFTAVPLAELPRLRTFRSHRARWDFEPYGIAIRREWLEHLGARPVVYGDGPLWERLPVTDRPFFQLLRRTPTVQPFNRSTIQPSPIDWSREREWRVLGDVDLSRATAEQVIVFVPSETEAQRLAKLCPWPIKILGPNSLYPFRADTAVASE